jgi:hypothetical protein
LVFSPKRFFKNRDIESFKRQTLEKKHPESVLDQHIAGIEGNMTTLTRILFGFPQYQSKVEDKKTNLHSNSKGRHGGGSSSSSSSK